MKISDLKVGDIIYRSYISHWENTCSLYRYEVLAMYKNRDKQFALLRNIDNETAEIYSDSGVYNVKLHASTKIEAEKLALSQLEGEIAEKERQLLEMRECYKRFSKLFHNECQVTFTHD